ncbi:MAG: nitroreductase family protein [Actinomycetota bacterium]
MHEDHVTPILRAIKNRRSVREFTAREVSEQQLQQILEAGRWAPSGLNNQPWRFVVVKEKDLLEKVARHTRYPRILREANVIIAVFLDTDEMYDRTKDVQAIGACIQNMLLTIHEMGLGACWLGEILNQRAQVEKLLDVPKSFELMAVLAIGYPQLKERKSSRKPINDLVYKVFTH